MCGIVCAFDLKDTSDIIRPNILKMVKKVRHRGPDWSGVYSSKNAVMAHERLAIVDPTSGKQPILSDDNNKAIAVNYWINKNLIKAKANTEIILSAGSIGSPHILQASGVGPGNLLKKYNINIENLISCCLM